MRGGDGLIVKKRMSWGSRRRKTRRSRGDVDKQINREGRTAGESEAERGVGRGNVGVGEEEIEGWEEGEEEEDSRRRRRRTRRDRRSPKQRKQRLLPEALARNASVLQSLPSLHISERVTGSRP
jgi:hypothetical protein